MPNPISDVEIIGLETSIAASGFSKRTNLSEYYHTVSCLKDNLKNKKEFTNIYLEYRKDKKNFKTNDDSLLESLKAFDRACRLGNVPGDSGHLQYLSGIITNFNLTFTNKVWGEAERYKFLYFVSSQSTIYSITKFDLNECYDENVDRRIVVIMQELVNMYNKISVIPDKSEDDKNAMKELYLKILMSNPSGFRLTARMSTNYRELKQIYSQRKDHILPEWNSFCRQLLDFPYFGLLCLNQ